MTAAPLELQTEVSDTARSVLDYFSATLGMHLRLDAKRYWPPEKERLLLKTAYHADSARAVQAWKDWRAIQNFDDTPWPQLRIVPAVGRRLPGILTDDLTPRLGGFRKYIWTLGATRVARATPFLKRLIAAGVTPLLMKGGARVAAHPPSLAERYFADLDVLIRPEDWKATCQVLRESGHAIPWDFSVDRLEREMRNTHHSIPIRAGDQVDVDLHQSSLLLNRQKGMDDGLWERSAEGKLGELPFRLPGRSDQLALIFGHGFLYADPRNYDWVGDALACIEAPGFDWELFERIVATRELSVPAAVGLRFLREELEVDIPRDTLLRIEKAVREPFIYEFDIYYSSSHFETADTPKLLQAELARVANVGHGAFPRGRALDMPWQQAGECGWNTFEIVVPKEAAYRKQTTLEIRYEIDGHTQPITLSLRSFDYFFIEIGRWTRSPEVEWRWLWNSRQISVRIPGALINAREIPRLRLILWPAIHSQLPAAMDKIPAAISYRWR